MEIKDIIYQRRKELGYSLEKLSQMVGVSKQTVQKWECGKISNMKRSNIAALSQALNVPIELLMGWEAPADRFPAPTVTDDYTTFPVLGDIAAGYDSIAIENWEGDTVDIPNAYLKGRDPSEFFVLRVKGDSMFPKYQDGDKVMILKQDTLNYSGQIGAVLYDGENATLKRVEYKDGEDWLRMVPINSNHPPRRIEGSDLERCRILGIPKLLIREIEE